ncbi:GumC family protein [Capilliphycus salinus ALCB114379]|uniref:GumC family protein n=1 Tax=Capilliphycus salinus TaxID=2768948 RepID=UPI0039A60B03
MTSSFSENNSEADLGYGKLLEIILRRRFWLLSIFVTVLSIAVVKTKWYTEPTYESKMQLLVQPNFPAKTTLEGEQETLSSEEDYATQLTLMRSSQFTEKAAQLLQSEYPLIEAEDIEKNLTLSQVEEGDTQTRIFAAVYTDNDPVKTQKVLEALQKLYLDYNIEQDRLRLEQGLSFINEGLPTAQEKLIQAEGSLEEFREQQNLIDPEQEAKAVSEALNTVEKDLLETRIQYQSAKVLYETLQEQLELSPQEAKITARLSESSRYQELLNQLQQTEVELAQQRTIFTDADPEVQKLLEQRQSLLALLRQEIVRVLGRIPPELNITTENLLKAGQLSGLDQALVRQLAETQTELETLQARLQSLAASKEELRAELNQFPSKIANYNRLQPEVEIQRMTIDRLLEKRQELSLEITRGGFNWQVVEPPQLGRQIAPSLKKNLALGGVVGLFLGGIAAFLRESMDDTVHSSDDLKEKVTIPLLGIVPRIPHHQVSGSILNVSFWKSSNQDPVILQTIYWLPFRESLDLIYKNIQLLTSPKKPKSLLVTSALNGAGKSTLVVGLAFSAARLHQNVLLIDANLRSPGLHEQLNLPNEQGLSTFLSSEISIPRLHQISALGLSIDVLTGGPVTPDPVKLLSSNKMRQLMRIFERNYDLILLDTSPVLGTVDVLETASFCDGVVLVERIDQVTQSELNQATAMLKKLNVIGIVANGASQSKNNQMTSVERNGKLSNSMTHSIINLRDYS